MTNTHRALWTFLIYALVAPFFGALVISVILLLAFVFGLVNLLPDDVTPSGTAAISSFVWAVVPALLTGIVLAALAWQKGGFSWVVAAAVAVIAFTIASVLVPFGLEDARPSLAIIAGLIAVGVRAVLVRMNVIAA